MTQNGPIAEFVTTEGVSFQVIRENWSNNKTPKFPAVLERYDGSQWHEVDRWDINRHTESSNVETYTDEEILQQAAERINNKQRFDDDGAVDDIVREFY